MIPIWQSDTHFGKLPSTYRCISAGIGLQGVCKISQTLCSVLPAVSQLAACLGRRPAPGNLCSGTYADLAAAGHRLCPRMWALGRCYEGGEDRGMLQKKKDRRAVVAFWPSMKEMSVVPQKVAHKKNNRVQCRRWIGGSN